MIEWFKVVKFLIVFIACCLVVYYTNWQACLGIILLIWANNLDMIKYKNNES